MNLPEIVNELNNEQSQAVTLDGTQSALILAGAGSTIQEVLQEVWVSTADKWRSICQKLKIGALLFTEFDDYFGKTEKDNLRLELNLLEKDDNNKWVDERLDQIQKYRNLKECMFGAEAILEVVETFELKVNFKQIRYIHELVSILINKDIFQFFLLIKLMFSSLRHR
jgi:hypothetical protein